MKPITDIRREVDTWEPGRRERFFERVRVLSMAADPAAATRAAYAEMTAPPAGGLVPITCRKCGTRLQGRFDAGGPDVKRFFPAV